jgi:acetylornithine/succinyldiaminopimelate/putrescine aminotransferase
LIAHVGRIGRYFEQRLRAMAARHHPLIADVRGCGLMWGLQLTRDATPAVSAALEQRVIVNRTAETVVRLLPALVITESEAEEGLGRLDAALGAVATDGGH